MSASLLFASALLALPLAPQSQPVPRIDGWVTDLAHFLTPAQEQSLEERMESFRRGSGNDIALLTIPNLHGEAIEDFARRVAREWKLGSVDKNNGALLVVAKDDREMRIEVGRGLEGTLPDIVCGRIIRDVITPKFHDDDYAGGLRLGVEALQRAAGGDYAPLPKRPASRRSGGHGFLPGGMLFFILLMVFTSLRRRRGGGGGGGGSIWPWIFVASSMNSRHDHFGGGFGGGGGGGSSGGGFSGFGGGGGFSGGGASGRW